MTPSSSISCSHEWFNGAAVAPDQKTPVLMLTARDAVRAACTVWIPDRRLPRKLSDSGTLARLRA
jgi:hypothetical protein